MSLLLLFGQSPVLATATGSWGGASTTALATVTPAVRATAAGSWGAISASAGDTQFNPLSLSPNIWLDASDTSTIATGAGGLVNTWSDKSGNGKTITRSTGSGVNSGLTTLNGKNVIDFTTASKLFAASTAADWKFLTDGTPTIIAMVVKPATTDSPGTVNYPILSVGQWNAAYNTVVLLWSNSTTSGQGNRIRTFAGNGTAIVVNNISSGSAMAANRFAALTAFHDGDASPVSARSSIYVNDDGVIANNTSTGTVSTSDPHQPLTLGSSLNSGFFAGSIAEIIIVSGVNATDANRQALYKYLRTKWMYPAVITEKFATAASPMGGWTATANATVHPFVQAQSASGTGTANAASNTINASARAGDATGAASNGSGSIKPSAETASSTGTANNASVSVSAGAGSGAGTGTGNAATGSLASSAGTSSATGTANQNSSTIKPTSGSASASGTGYDLTTENIQVSAGSGSASGTANDATVVRTTYASAALAVPGLYSVVPFSGSLTDSRGKSTLTEQATTTSGYGTDTNGTYWYWTSTDSRGGGLVVDTDTVLSSTWSLLLEFSFDDVDGYRKLIDFSDRTSDNGFYVNDGYLYFYGNSDGTSGTSFIAASTFTRILLVRDAESATLRGYSVAGDGTLTSLWDDVYGAADDSQPVTVGNGSRFILFRDDTATNNEATTGGKVYSLQLWNNEVITSLPYTEPSPFTASATVSVPASGAGAWSAWTATASATVDHFAQAESASGTGTGNDATALANVTASPTTAQATGTAQDAAGSVRASSGDASATGSGSNAAGALSPSAQAATASGSGSAASSSIAASSSTGTATGTGFDVTDEALQVNAQAGAASGDGYQSAANVGVSASTATALGSGNDATVDVQASNVNALAGAATATGSASDASLSIATQSDASDAEGSGQGASPVPSVIAVPWTAEATGAGSDAGFSTTVSVGQAAATGQASDAYTSLSALASTGQANGTAFDLTDERDDVSAGAATANGQALDASLLIAGRPSTADSTGTGTPAVPNVNASASFASATGTSFDVTDERDDVSAGSASGSGEADHASTSVKPSASTAAGTGTGFNAHILIATSASDGSASGEAFHAYLSLQPVPGTGDSSGSASNPQGKVEVYAGSGESTGAGLDGVAIYLVKAYAQTASATATAYGPLALAGLNPRTKFGHRVVIYDAVLDTNSQDRVAQSGGSASVSIDHVGSGGDDIALSTSSSRVTITHVGSGNDRVTISP